jgi:hypothetical protein
VSGQAPYSRPRDHAMHGGKFYQTNDFNEWQYITILAKDQDTGDDISVFWVSGCHLDPAVSIGLWAGGRFPASQLLPYIVMNTSVNPARSTGVALFAGGLALEQLWFFWVAQIALQPVMAIPLGGTKTLSLGNSGVLYDIERSRWASVAPSLQFSLADRPLGGQVASRIRGDARVPRPAGQPAHHVSARCPTFVAALITCTIRKRTPRRISCLAAAVAASTLALGWSSATHAQA